MAEVGIDFGTTNSSVIHIGGNGRVSSLLSAPNGITVQAVPSYISIRSDRTGVKKILCGLEIPDPEVRATNGNLVVNLKTKLRDSSDNNLIMGFDKWNLLEKYMQYLINNANRSPIITNAKTRIDRVVLSVPYESDAIYVEKIKSITEKAIYTDSNNKQYHISVAHVQEEPVAIALAYFSQPNAQNKVLVYDMGGGTTDFSVVERDRFKASVLRHDGLSVAGNHIDELIAAYFLQQDDFSTEKFFSTSNRLLERSMLTVRIAKESIERGSKSVPITLRMNNEYELDEDLTKEQYEKIIQSFIKETVRKALSLIDSSVTTAVLAGGGANCKMIHNTFKAISSLKILSSDNDKTIATAQGNAEWFHIPTINLLNHSYAIRYKDTKKDTLFIQNAIFKDEILPIREKKVLSYTISQTDSVIYHFYLGNDLKKKSERIYNYSNYNHLADKAFTFKFRKEMPANTEICTYISVSAEGIITLKFESKDADTQYFTLMSGMS